MKKLYRSRENRIFGGLMGGLGEYFDIDARLLRVAWIMVCVLSVCFPAILAYIFSCMIVPVAPKNHEKSN